jgi:predicted secreted hydrolase
MGRSSLIALALVLSLLSTAVEADAPQLGLLSPGEVAEQGFAQVLEPRTFHFPADHGPHPTFRQEWWYVTGNLDAATGERFGFELTFFRVALAPPEAAGTPLPARSSWRTREIYTAHFAVTDVSRKQLRFGQKWSRAALKLAGATAEPFAVWLDDWSIRATQQDNWHLSAASAGYGLSVDLRPLTPPVLNGHEGLSIKSNEPGSASYYYSLPRMVVHGELLRDGRPFTVHGLAWLDREWGSGNLGRNEVGWDWFGLQLQDGTALMFYAMRNQDGSRDPASGGTWIESNGHSRELASQDVQLDVSRHWLSARGGNYPARWRLKIPKQGLDIEISPVVADQELDTVPSYWEGAVDVAGTRSGRPIKGRGYVELVGYGRSASPK